MNRKKVRLSTPEMIADFINVCSSSKYDDYDITLYDGKSKTDAKSVIGVFAIAQGKEIETEIITDDKSVISSFIEDMKKFEV